MNKDRIKGKMKDVSGRIERQAGEWTDNPKMQGEGAAKQVEGKVQHTWGKAKDAARDVKDDMKKKAERERKDRPNRDIETERTDEDLDRAA